MSKRVYTINGSPRKNYNTAQLRGFLERLWYPFVQFKRGEPQVQFCYDTLQYRDYDRYWANTWNVEGKKLRHEQQFPKDLQAARQLGYAMTK